jgi:hypothetical protein
LSTRTILQAFPFQASSQNGVQKILQCTKAEPTESGKAIPQEPQDVISGSARRVEQYPVCTTNGS